MDNENPGCSESFEDKTKLSVTMNCDSCSRITHLDEQWYCNRCGELLCSWCAMKNHRDHDCNNWQDGNIVRECLETFRPYSKLMTQNIDNQIDEYCDKLAVELKNRSSAFQEAAAFVKRVENVFGLDICAESSKNDQRKSDKNLKKKLNLVNTVVSSVDKMFNFDADKLIELNQYKSSQFFDFPAANLIADLFFKKLKIDKNLATAISIPISVEREKAKLNLKQENLRRSSDENEQRENALGSPSVRLAQPNSASELSKELTQTTVPEGSKAEKCILSSEKDVDKAKSPKVVEKLNKIHVPTVSIEPPSTDRKLLVGVSKPLAVVDKPPFVTSSPKAKQAAFKNALNLCAIPNVGVVVLDDNGIHFLNDVLEYRKFKGWSAQGNYSVRPSVVYHSGRKSIFVLREVPNNNADAKKILEYNFPALTRVSATSYPSFADNGNRLLGVTKAGLLICASSSSMWIKRFDPPIAEGIFWRRSVSDDLESFTALLVGSPIDGTTESIYVMGTTRVYIFAYTFGSSCRLLHCISNLRSPMIYFKNIVYASNKDRTSLMPISLNQQASRLPVQGKSNYAADSDVMFSDVMSCDEKYIYLLNFKANNFVQRDILLMF